MNASSKDSELFTADFIVRAKQENIINLILDFIEKQSEVSYGTKLSFVCKRFKLTKEQTKAILSYLLEKGAIISFKKGKGLVYFSSSKTAPELEMVHILEVDQKTKEEKNKLFNELIESLPKNTDKYEDTDFTEESSTPQKKNLILDLMNILELSLAERAKLYDRFRDSKDLKKELKDMVEKKFLNDMDSLV